MDMLKILAKFSELDSLQGTQQLNESEKGVTKHKGKYGTSHKAGDESHKGDDGEKKTPDTSHLQAFLGKKPADHDSKEGRVHKASDEPPKDSKYGDKSEAPKKRGRPKKNLKDWIEALDEMIAEEVTAQPAGGTAAGTGIGPGTNKYEIKVGSNNTVQLINPEGMVVKTENTISRSALEREAAMLNSALAKKTQASAQSTTPTTSTTQAVTEEEMEESGLQAYLGKKKYGERGMKALQKAGREGASDKKMASIRAKHDKLDEKWDKETKVAPSEQGKYKGKSKAELLKMYNALKKSGPHKKGSPEFSKMRELQFAIRAKGDWGKVQEADVVFGADASPLSMANQQGGKKLGEAFLYPPASDSPERRKDSDKGTLPVDDVAQDSTRGRFKEIFKDDEVRVVQPLDQMAIQYFGKGTAWDIAKAPGERREFDKWDVAGAKTNFFDMYKNKGPIYIIIPTKKQFPGERYAVQLATNIIVDNRDTRVSLATLQNRFPRLSYLFKHAPVSHPDKMAEGKKMSKKKIKEGTDPHEAARSEGRAHAMGGHSYSCRHKKGTMEAQCYHEGYIHALEECYGGMNEEMVEEESLLPPKRDIFRGKPDVKTVEPFKAPERVSPEPAVPSKVAYRQMPGQGLPMRGDQYDSPLRRGMDKLRGMFKEDDLEESPFSWAAKNTPEGEKFTVGGKTFTKKADEGMYQEGWNEGMYEEDLDAIASDPMLEGWDQQLNQLLNEGTLNEGLTVTTSTGQQGMPDSVSISASDEDAQKLMQILKMSGLGGAGSGDAQVSPQAAAQHITRPGAQLTVTSADDYEQEGAEDDDSHFANQSGQDSAIDSIKSPAMSFPSGGHFSRPSEDDEVEVIEPYEHDEVIDALDCGDEMKRITNKLIALEAYDPTDKTAEMPDGMMSVNTKDKPAAEPEVTDREKVMNKLGKNAPKDSGSVVQTADKSTGTKTKSAEEPSGIGMMSSAPTEKSGDVEEPKDPSSVLSALGKDAPKDSGKAPVGGDSGSGGSKGAKGPSGAGMMSVASKDKEQKIPEPKDPEAINKALAKESPKEGDAEFAALKKLIQAQMPKSSAELPKADGEQDIPTPTMSDSEGDVQNTEKNLEGEKEKREVKESREKCDECGAMYEGAEDDHVCEAEHLDEWANSLRDGKKSKLSDEQFVADTDFMVDTMAGGLNGPQVMRPHGYRNSDNPIAMKENGHESLREWLRLSGIK